MSGVFPQKSGRKFTALPSLAALASGIGLALSAQPIGWWALAWISLIPLGWALTQTQKPLLLGWLAGSSYYLILLHWLLGIHPLDWRGIPFWPSLGIAIGAWLFVSLFEGLSFAIWAWIMAQTTQWSALQRIIWAVGSWTCIAYVWNSGPLGFGWGVLAATQSNSFFLPLVQLGGEHFLGAIIVGINGLLLEGLRQRKWKFLVLAIVLMGAAGLWRGLPLEEGRDIKIGVIQGNIGQEQRGIIGPQRVMDIYTEGYITLAQARPDVILTPETALTEVWDHIPLQQTSIGQAVLKQKIPLLMGALGVREQKYGNSLFFTNGNLAILNVYDKVNLVPFGETIPFSYLFADVIRKFTPFYEDLYAGPLTQKMETPLGIMGVSICFDAVFPDVLRTQTLQGAEVLVTVTNDAWFGSSMPPQRHALETLRAVENARWLVRASNTGSSAVIDPTGVTHLLTEYNQYRSFIAPMNLQTQLTPYTQWGEAWFWGIGVGMLGVAVTRMLQGMDFSR